MIFSMQGHGVTVQGQRLLEGMGNKLLVLVDQSYLGKGSLHQCLDSYFFINKKMNVLTSPAKIQLYNSANCWDINIERQAHGIVYPATSS